MLGKLFITGFLLTLSAFPVRGQEEKPPVNWSLSSEKPVSSLNRGDEFKAYLNASIEKGWHLYALEKIDGGAIPTRITVAEESAFSLGKIDAPTPVEVEDTAFGITVKFYEDAVKFTLPIKVSESFESGKSALRIRVRYQTCNDQMCLPPKTVTIDADSKQQMEDN